MTSNNDYLRRIERQNREAASQAAQRAESARRADADAARQADRHSANMQYAVEDAAAAQIKAAQRIAADAEAAATAREQNRRAHEENLRRREGQRRQRHLAYHSAYVAAHPGQPVDALQIEHMWRQAEAHEEQRARAAYGLYLQAQRNAPRPGVPTVVLVGLAPLTVLALLMSGPYGVVPAVLWVGLAVLRMRKSGDRLPQAVLRPVALVAPVAAITALRDSGTTFTPVLTAVLMGLIYVTWLRVADGGREEPLPFEAFLENFIADRQRQGALYS
ncbi:hypothetical protein ACI8AA_01250 [Geodermatophilus sp. SYSU D01180]